MTAVGFFHTCSWSEGFHVFSTIAPVGVSKPFVLWFILDVTPERAFTQQGNI